VPIVHKTSLKSVDSGKTLNKALIIRQLLIYTNYDFTDKMTVFARFVWGMACIIV
jgi:hypothetical protein